MQYFTKKLFKSNLGIGGMHDKYITVPQSINPKSFFGEPPETIEFLDKESKTSYYFNFRLENNGEYRLYRLASFYDKKNAVIDDEILIEKEITSDGIVYNIDLIKLGSSKKPSNNFTPPTKNLSGQGYNLSQPQKKAIELRAMEVAKDYYESKN